MTDALRSISGAQHAGSAGVYETTQHFNDIKEHLHVVKRDIEHLVQRATVIYVLGVFSRSVTQLSLALSEKLG